MSSPVSYDLQGQGGGIVLSNADSSVTGDFRWIQVLNDAVITNLVSSNIENIGDLDGLTFPAGVGFGGRFSQIEVSSGVVIAYYA